MFSDGVMSRTGWVSIFVLTYCCIMLCACESPDNTHPADGDTADTDYDMAEFSDEAPLTESEPLDEVEETPEIMPDGDEDSGDDAADTEYDPEESPENDPWDDDADEPIGSEEEPAQCIDDDPFPPDRVYFRTANRSFNLRWYVILNEGRIWVKPNEETGGAGDWTMLGATGMPEGNALPNFGVPQSITEISADGVHLQALSNAGAFYRGTDMTGNILLSFTWTDRWGGTGATGDGLTMEFSTQYGWSVSDSHPLGVDHYEDPNGQVHSVGMGVAHLYRLGPDGRDIFFNDWWLPNDWSRQICGPDRSTFKALNISVSASTMFLIGERGEMYTRLYDFDTGGENSLLTYSYIVTGPAGTTRKLPAEDWRRQPDITDGLITKKITIFQNGQGNAARVLRVEGVQNGITGFFYKGIYDPAWSFQQTGRTVCGPFLNDPDSPVTPSAAVDPVDARLAGTLSLDNKSVGIVLENFNMVCSPARAHILYNGQIVTAGGQPLDLAFHHVHTMVENKRPTRYWLSGIPAYVQAALLIPASINQIDDPAAKEYITSLFGTRKVINFLGNALPQNVELSEIMWTELFRVPAEEKAFLSGFRLSVTGAP